MAIELDELDIDRQIDYAFGVLFSLDMVGFFGAAVELISEEETDDCLSEALPSLNPVLYVMERDLFALMAWTLLKTADLERGRFASPFMNAIHCMEEGGTVCPLESDPRKYFADEECAELAPAIVADIDTILRCCFENGMHPVLFLKDAVKGLLDFGDPRSEEAKSWERPLLRFHSLMVEMDKYPEQTEEAMDSLLDLTEQFFDTPFYELNSFHLDECCLRCDMAGECDGCMGMQGCR